MMSKILATVISLLYNILSFIRHNIKKILISTVAFIISFLTVLIILFPKTEVAKTYLDKYILSTNLPIKYDSIDVGYFSTTIKGISYDGKININVVTAKYNPVGLFLKKLTVTVESRLLSINIDINKDSISINGKVLLDLITSLTNIDASGTLNIDSNYNLLSKKGEINISSNTLSIVHPMMTIKADSLNSLATIDGATLNINKFEATGSNSIMALGKVILMTQHLSSSILDIKGKANFSGLESNFTLSGSVNAPQFSLQ